MSWPRKLRLVSAAGLGLLFAFVLGRCSSGRPHLAGSGAPVDGALIDGALDSDTSAEAEVWSCPMHPEVELAQFGPCPKCGMDLTVRKADDLGPRQLAMSEAAVALANIETTPVARRFVTRSVRLAGTVDYDETQVRTVAARVAGRLDRLFVDYVGVRVAHHDHLVLLYSPELLAAQQELIEAKKRVDEMSPEQSDFMAESSRQGYRSARQKLLLWGLSGDQVDAIEARGTAEDHLLIESPTEGVVLEKFVDEGDYVQEGTEIYRIADLSRVWIQLDVYEQDLSWVRYGQNVTMSAEAIPGEVFEGWISFVAPHVDPKTRVVQVRVHVDNQGDRLKPGMFVRGVVQARLGGRGQVLEPRLQGKWISPMHPEIVKDGPGTCDVCGMALVPAESFLAGPGRSGEAAGAVDLDAAAKPLVIPASAVLVTGKRAVVYVAVPGQGEPVFEGREVILGPRAGDEYIVREGLREHERVVTTGAFRVDSSMQIRAKPSMMSMPGSRGSALLGKPEYAEFRTFLGGSVLLPCLDVQEALAADDLARARSHAVALGLALEKPGGVSLLSRDGRTLWADEHAALERAGAKIAAAESIDDARVAFEDLTRSALLLARAFFGERLETSAAAADDESDGQGTWLEAHCPMAFDNRGASWLQRAGKLANPYFGASMLRCGTVTLRLRAGGTGR